MLTLESDLEGRIIRFDSMCSIVQKRGYVLCGNWEYDRGKFDHVLWRHEGETIYIRLPFKVVKGMLDRKDAHLKFSTPYIIKHVVHEGLESDSEGLMTVAGFSQFQKPLDPDGKINDHDQWREIARQSLAPIVEEMTAYSIA